MEGTRRFQEIRPRSMRFDVLRQLRDAILDGRYKPGERLNESEIAREMGISRGPVREAIQALQQEGLVDIEHWRGAYVVQLDPDSFRELVDLRILLETHAARIATRRCAQENLRELDNIIEEMRQAGRERDVDQVVHYDLKFHRTICRLSGNRLLLKTWEQLAGRLRLAILLSIERGYYDPIEMVETHPPVVEAMKRCDVEGAAHALNARTLEAAETILSTFVEEREQA